MEKKEYCIQNDNDCSTCSLSNYNRDCQNNVIKKIDEVCENEEGTS